ncbi:hypothetical protein IGI04_043059 [Brassica rapa subsp. trilocularis]|uniref:Uncharacterized protein n=1 Tax=Brassica rapa subsp. trilocularis TaxID=1813537 RepID=A0ABQ7KGW9_BRACM|nr:hypothetical protein IGI04_043059 [Brassica rapa subsp. trilocularis]
MGLESGFRYLWAVFRLEAFTTISFDKERTFRDSIEGLTRMHGLVSSRKSSVATQRPNFGSSTVASDRAGRTLGHYVATRSLRSDRAWRV